jgi:hypothetical protein
MPRRPGEVVVAAAKAAAQRSPPRPARNNSAFARLLEPNALHISVALLLIGSLGWCVMLYRQLQPSILVAPAFAAVYSPPAEPGGLSSIARTDRLPLADAVEDTAGIRIAHDGLSAAAVIAREWNFFNRGNDDERRMAQIKDLREPRAKPRVQLASLENSGPPDAALSPAPATAMPRFPASIDAKTSLVGFETAPFPYDGTVPGSNRPFLNTGDGRGHVSFRGRVYWQSPTYSDNRVLLHIPPGFDPQRPAVMVVFFHGHGANLARDVRDRQRVPAQITAAGVNAVLVAPQFAVDAADSSAGKFWEPNGFKRFLDEASVKLARLYGDPRSAAAFANMPIVIVAYSGGFGPLLSVLDRGGVNKSRIRGLVLLDALYAGMDRFADWIANNRSAFFISSYTPHTAARNVYLEHLLGERAIPYSLQLRRSHLQGTVAFLPAGDVSHRNFVTHAWGDNPIEDVLARMDNVDPSGRGVGVAAAGAASAYAATGRD